MRKFVLLTMTVIALSVACHSGKRWQVSGEWKEGEGKTVYLLKQVEDTLLTVDSAVVRQGKYRMEGWDCPVVAAYRITAIPKMFLLDPQGRIAGIDLSEQELRAKLDTLLANK